MWKISNLLILILLPVINIFSQTGLPASFGFETIAFPNGWTKNLSVSNNAETYSGGSEGSLSCKLDGIGEYVQIWFADEPATLTYYLQGKTVNQPFSGTFDVQQSANGTSWTTLHSHTSLNTSSFTQFTDNPLSTSRYIRFYFTTKANGKNVALDQVSLSIAAPGPIEVNVKYGVQKVISGSTVVIGNAASSSFTIENLGTSQNLNISGNTITGTNASQFSVSTMPASVTHGSSANFILQFTPAGAAGSKYATISIGNNDADENPFIINLHAINGAYAAEPTAQPSYYGTTTLSSYALKFSFSPASPAPEKYIVLRRDNSDFTEVPLDGHTYTIGDYIGTAQVAYIGGSGFFTPTHIVANTQYYFKIFSFNGPAGYENYLTVNPLSWSKTSSNPNIGTYYNGISPYNSTFITDLHNKILPHTQYSYDDYDNYLVKDFLYRDTTGGQKAVTCVYSGYDYIYNDPFIWNDPPNSGMLAREHTYCFSWMPTSITSSSVAYSDYHNLFPAHQTGANAVRSDNPFGEVVNITSSFGDAKYGKDANGANVYEPRDEQKGDAARALFYMCVCYNGDAGQVWKLPSDQNQAVLKAWHNQDPPDKWEMARNDYIYAKQGNRNPFIDHPEWVRNIDFSTMTYLGVDENMPSLFNALVVPNPSDGNFTVAFNLEKSSEIFIEIYDMTGKMVATQKESLATGNPVVKIENRLPGGIYILKAHTPEQVFVGKIISVCP